MGMGWLIIYHIMHLMRTRETNHTFSFKSNRFSRQTRQKYLCNRPLILSSLILLINLFVLYPS